MRRRQALASIYNRLSKLAARGMKRLRARANRAGPEHLAADAGDLDYIEREAHDILGAVQRMRMRDAAEYPGSGAFSTPETMPMTEPHFGPAPDPLDAPLAEIEPYEPYAVSPETQRSGNMSRGRRSGRRNRSGDAAGEARLLMRKYRKAGNTLAGAARNVAIRHRDVYFAALASRGSPRLDLDVHRP